MSGKRISTTLTLLGFCIVHSAAWAESRFHAALHSITSDELRDIVTVLADDVYEGRLAGSRGGRAAGQYIAQQLDEFPLIPAGDGGTWYQACGQGYRNILARHAGRDVALAHEVIVVSAHYDHVGYGTPKNSFGPIGQIHNGADDNASGVSALLELIEALAVGSIETRRSILFAFWDGEEIGMVGSTHWAEHPTVPIEHIPLAINIDMIGWLRSGRLEVVGVRSGYGMRRFVSEPLERPLWLDFSWELKANSDHWPLFARGVPVALFHTGEHDHYHRPTDDVERINHDGLAQVSRYLLNLVVTAANADTLPAYRPAARHESPLTERQRHRPAPPPPPRFGFHWRPASDGSVTLTHVMRESPAGRGGLLAGDRLLAINKNPINDASAMHRALLRASGPVELTFVRAGSAGEQTIAVAPFGPPVRLGISWRADEAEPRSVFLTHVVPGSPAAAAGLAEYDRIYEIAGRPFDTMDDFGRLVRDQLDAQAPKIDLLVETAGYIRPVAVELETSHPTTQDGR